VIVFKAMLKDMVSRGGGLGAELEREEEEGGR